MPSTYSPLLRLELIGAGEQSGLWGETTNKNLGDLLEQAIAGVTTISLSGGAGDYTLKTSDGALDEARAAVLKFEGNPSGTKTIIIPTKTKLYVVRNQSGQTIIFKTVGQVSNLVTVLDGEATLVFCDGSSALAGIQTKDVGTLTVPGGGTGATSFISGFIKSPGGTGSLTAVATVNASTEVAGTLPSANGGTGRSTLTGGRLLVGDGTNPVGLLGGSSDGQVATWDGPTSQWVARTPSAQSTFVTGMIMLWAGALNTVPTGWALCNGANGTPDLRDRFVVGAGNTYQVNATGGAASVTLLSTNLPSHTHSFSISGSTANADASHSHTLSGSTGLDGALHTHSFAVTSATESVSHTHSSGTLATAEAGSHSHTVLSGAANNAQGAAGTTDIGSIANNTTSTAGAHSHTLTGSTSNQSQNHTHAVSGNTQNASANHSHTLSGNTSSSNASHVHTFSATGTTDSTGTGTAFSVLPPYYALAYIMKL
jgi:hypothetical protein